MKALLIVQGINCNGKYLKEDFEDFRQLKTLYKDYENAPVEKSWDKRWYCHIPLVGDKFGDIWSFYRNEQARIKACEIVRERIIDLKKDFEEIDILSHSLGTVITLCSGPMFASYQPPIQVNDVYLMQSPIGLGIPILKGMALAHAERYATNFIAKRIHNLYSSKDMVSSNLKPENERQISILQRCSIEKVRNFDLKVPHDSFECLEQVVDKNLWT